MKMGWIYYAVNAVKKVIIPIIALFIIANLFLGILEIPIPALASSTLLNNIKSYYEFSGNSNDATGNGNNGSDTSITYGTAYGKIGEGADFNGSSSYISLGNPSDLQNADFTYSGWFNLQNTPSFFTLISKNYRTAPWSSPYATILIRVDNSSTIEVGLSNGSTYTAHNYSVSLSTNTWYNLVFTYNGTTGILYLNGSEVASNTYSVTLTYNTQPWYIGADNSASPQGDHFNGYMDEIGIWSRALTSTEVTQLYNSGKGLQYPFGVSFIFWQFFPF